MNSAIIRIASRLFPGRDLWKLTSEEMSKVMDIYNDYY
tara:strand:+ start:1942 stop:2055 length:114 start_codon:yes stop_codon:yes gene_type:complete